MKECIIGKKGRKCVDRVREKREAEDDEGETGQVATEEQTKSKDGEREVMHTLTDTSSEP